jgi:hypothetical protein
MRTHGLIFLSAVLGLTTLGVVACSDDGTLGSPSNDPGSSSGTSGSNSGPGSSGSSGDSNNKPEEVVEGDITADRTLDASKSWLLKGLVSVKAGATLTIQPGTTIKGDNASKAILLIESGAKINAQGSADAPIVFTSQAKEGEKKPGQWGGLIVLGKAPVNIKDSNGNPITGNVEGILKTPGQGAGTTYGGTDENDNSGVLSYVRIEYSGVVIATDNEVNGITFAGVGRGTKVDHVQVRQTLDDCFEFFGGTVDAKYLACQRNQDDGFDFDLGYRGRLQFLVLQQDPVHEGDDNGIESDNDDKASANAPLTGPTMYNATLCGKNKSVGGQQFGLLLRKNTRGTYKNLVVSGFQAALDLRDNIGGAGELSITNSLVWGSTGAGSFPLDNNIAFIEDKTSVPSGEDEKKYKARPDWNDDGAIDEAVWFNTGDVNRVVDPGIAGCFNATAPVFGPAASLTEKAAPPPNDGFFDTTATYMGAFKDATDTWATTGKWAVWTDK